MTPLDIVVFGATGTSGAQVARLLAQRVADGATFTLGIAGRSVARLEDLRASLPAPATATPCDANDTAGVTALAARTGVMVSTIAPYVDHGEPMVAACARAGTDYLDLSAETAQIRRLIDAHQATAQRTGARLVPTCGFDAAISDLGVHILIAHFRERRTDVAEIRALFRCAGGWNAGTVASAQALWKRPADQEAMRDPFLLLPPETPRPLDRARHLDPSAAVRDHDVGRWVAPFWMGPINTRVVRRSLTLDRGESAAPLPTYHEFWDPGGPADFAMAQAVAASWGVWQQLSRVPTVATAMSASLAPWMALGERWPTSGFRALFLGRGRDGSRAWARVRGPLDPANGATAAIATEAAVLLAQSRGRVTPGGFLTPATAFGRTLATALLRHGIRTECPHSPSWAHVARL